MKDSYGRTIDYMRISITDRCNLRCKYCMPDGVPMVPMSDILSLEEIVQIASCGAKLGIHNIKVTGGEPLVRKGCASLIRELKAIPGIECVTLTTNGLLLEACLQDLLAAGLDGVNISLDTLNSERYDAITGTDGLATVKRAIDLAASASLPVKLNCVSLDWDETFAGDSQSADGSWRGMVEFARNHPVDVRFIEMMPIGYGRQFKSLNHQELLENMKRLYPDLTADSGSHGPGPAVYYRIPGFQGSIGLISAIHGKFCENCNRVRLTAQGYLKTCLCYEDGADLRAVLRNGTGGQVLEEELTSAIRQAILKKPNAHCFERPEEMTEQHSMVMIGG
ncbi:MAG: GTP 3',8-cyclase MoaA [Lachnospiraceae bacterium]|nr:GTP 3',8-cyclase MoaA [Lachnospiraceae bacterium]